MRIEGKFTKSLIPIALLEIGAVLGEYQAQRFVIDTGFNEEIFVSQGLKHKLGLETIKGLSADLDTPAGRITCERCQIYMKWDSPPVKVVVAHVGAEISNDQDSQNSSGSQFETALIGTRLMENMTTVMQFATETGFVISS